MVSQNEAGRRRDIVNPPTIKRGKSEGRKKAVSFIENFTPIEEKSPQKLPEPPKTTNDYS
jgi:hypothetical protein